MLINFSVENFRSFGAEQTLNLIASGKLQGHEDHCVPIDDTGKSVLRTGVIYGANAAGKSNVVHAIGFAKGLIQQTSRFNQLALNQFRFGKAGKSSSFEFRFLVEGQIFVYGFTINQNAVVEEWLETRSPKGRDVEVFRRAKQKITVGNLRSLGKEAAQSERALKAFAKDLGPRPEQLLLNKVVDLPSPSRGELLDRAAWWFTDCLTLIQPSANYGPLLEVLSNDERFRRFAAEFLQNVGTGISGLHIERSEISAGSLPQQLLEDLQGAKFPDSTIFLGSPNVSLQPHPEDPTKVIRRNLAALHTVDQAEYSMPFQDESDGTQRCLNLLPALYHMTTSSNVFVIDELDRSLHPLLSQTFLRFFIESCPGAYQQLIVTTHETHLLDQELLRRDEIWFVEKDAKQQTQLYSLADMKIRNDVRIERGYLQGRFGGIPFIGDTKKLMDLIQCPSNGKPHAKKAPLDRSTDAVRDANLIVISSEDKYAVRQYFDFFESTRIQFKVLETRDGKSAPEHILARLDEYMNEYQIGQGDEFWLVCDCDHWIDGGHIKNLVQVMRECRKKGIQVALSNPCFELWLFLHFAEFPAEDKLSCADLEKCIRSNVGAYEKTKVYKLPITNEAVKAAVKRSTDREPNTREIPDQPQSSVHRIIQHLMDREMISVRQ